MELYTSSLYSDANLQGYWRLENNFTDETANNNDLTNRNSTAFATAKFGSGADFESGSLQYADIAHASQTNLNGTGSKTISCWFKPESIGVNHVLVSKDNAVAEGYLLYITSGNNPRFIGRGLTTNTLVTSTETVSAGSWYHVVGVYDSSGSKLKIFVNGVKTEVTASGTTAASSVPFAIGAREKGGTQDLHADGILDDVAFFDRALTDTEVNSLYIDGTKSGLLLLGVG